LLVRWRLRGKADKRPIYGGFFWINGDGRFPVPTEAFYMSGVGGQTTLIIRLMTSWLYVLGHYKGSEAGDKSFKKALAILMEAVPAKEVARIVSVSSSKTLPNRVSQQRVRRSGADLWGHQASLRRIKGHPEVIPRDPTTPLLPACVSA